MLQGLLKVAGTKSLAIGSPVELTVLKQWLYSFREPQAPVWETVAGTPLDKVLRTEFPSDYTEDRVPLWLRY